MVALRLTLAKVPAEEVTKSKKTPLRKKMLTAVAMMAWPELLCSKRVFSFNGIRWMWLFQLFNQLSFNFNLHASYNANASAELGISFRLTCRYCEHLLQCISSYVNCCLCNSNVIQRSLLGCFREPFRQPLLRSLAVATRLMHNSLVHLRVIHED